MESFSLFLQVIEDFQTHLRCTFLDMFWNKGCHLKDRNLSYKINCKVISKYHLKSLKMPLKKALLHINGVTSINNIVNVCMCVIQCCVMKVRVIVSISLFISSKIVNTIALLYPPKWALGKFANTAYFADLGYRLSSRVRGIPWD